MPKTYARKSARPKTRRVREGSAEPRWMTRELLDAMHDAQLREHGGSSGVRDEGLLESALNRPKNKFAYGETDLAVLAAAYALGIARNHGYVDGNKRAAFTAAALFLAINDLELDAPEPEVVDVVNRLAAGKLTEASFADWIREHIRRG
jgi:death on curing protein